MALQADSKGVCEVSTPDMAQQLGISRWTVWRALQQLRADHWVRCVALRVGGPNRYRLNLHPWVQRAPALSPDHPLHDIDKLRRLVKGHRAFRDTVSRGADPDELFDAVLERLTVREGKETRFDPTRASWATYVYKVTHSVCSNTTRHRTAHPEHHCTTPLQPHHLEP
jgi:hypothetical protein